MCYLVSHKVKSIKGTSVVFTNGLKAFYNKKIGRLKINDEVLVYGNLILNIIKKYEKHKTNL